MALAPISETLVLINTPPVYDKHSTVAGVEDTTAVAVHILLGLGNKQPGHNRSWVTYSQIKSIR